MRNQTFVLLFVCLLITATLIGCDQTQTQGNLPDLVPSSSDPSGSFCTVQEGPKKQLQLVVSVKNQGNVKAEESETIVRFSASSVEETQAMVPGGNITLLLATPAIQPGATVTLEAVDVPKNCGSPKCVATIIVDSTNRIIESNKNNNTLTCIVPLGKD